MSVLRPCFTYQAAHFEPVANVIVNNYQVEIRVSITTNQHLRSPIVSNNTKCANVTFLFVILQCILYLLMSLKCNCTTPDQKNLHINYSFKKYV